MSTGIEWTDETWNPVTGCSKVSPGCAHCYAEGVADRFWAKQYPLIPVSTAADLDATNTFHRPRKFTDVMCHEDRLDQPLRWRKPRRIFVNSMSDLFHEDVPDQFIDKVFAVMALAPQHTFQILTKRAERMRDYCQKFAAPWSLDHGPGSWEGVNIRGLAAISNVWLGVSVENQRFADERIPLLLQTPAAVRFISAEPLLGPVDLTQVYIAERHYRKDALRRSDLEPPAVPDAKLDWVIVGGESGAGARPMHPDWVRSLRDQCAAAGVSFFYKQHGAWKPFYDRDKDDPDWQSVPKESPRVTRLNLAGGSGFHGERVVYLRRVGKKAAGRLLDGSEWNEFPKREREQADAPTR